MLILGDPGAVSQAGESERQRKFSKTGERAPGHRISPDRFQTAWRMPAPDWAQKSFVLLCQSANSNSRVILKFVCCYTQHCCFAILVRFVDKGFAGTSILTFLTRGHSGLRFGCQQRELSNVFRTRGIVNINIYDS